MYERKGSFGVRVRWRPRQRQKIEMTRVACAGADRVWATADNPRTESLAEIFKDMKKNFRQDRTSLS